MYRGVQVLLIWLAEATNQRIKTSEVFCSHMIIWGNMLLYQRVSSRTVFLNARELQLLKRGASHRVQDVQGREKFAYELLNNSLDIHGMKRDISWQDHGFNTLRLLDGLCYIIDDLPQCPCLELQVMTHLRHSMLPLAYSCQSLQHSGVHTNEEI